MTAWAACAGDLAALPWVAGRRQPPRAVAPHLRLPRARAVADDRGGRRRRRCAGRRSGPRHLRRWLAGHRRRLRPLLGSSPSSSRSPARARATCPASPTPRARARASGSASAAGSWPRSWRCRRGGRARTSPTPSSTTTCAPSPARDPALQRHPDGRGGTGRTPRRRRRPSPSVRSSPAAGATGRWAPPASSAPVRCSAAWSRRRRRRWAALGLVAAPAALAVAAVAVHHVHPAPHRRPRPPAAQRPPSSERAPRSCSASSPSHAARRCQDRHSTPTPFPVVRELNPQLATLEGEGPFLFEVEGLRFAEPYSVAIQAELQRRGIEFRSTDEGIVRQLGESRRADGTERTRLVVRRRRAGDRADGGRTSGRVRVVVDGRERRELARLTDEVSAIIATEGLPLSSVGRGRSRGRRSRDRTRRLRRVPQPGAAHLRRRTSSTSSSSGSSPPTPHDRERFERWADLRYRAERETVALVRRAHHRRRWVRCPHARRARLRRGGTRRRLRWAPPRVRRRPAPAAWSCSSSTTAAADADGRRCSSAHVAARPDVTARVLRRPHLGKGAAVAVGLGAAAVAARRLLRPRPVDAARPARARDRDGGARRAASPSRPRDLAGSRLTRPEGAVRELLGRSYNRLLQATVTPGVVDTQCGAKAAATDVWERILVHAP